MKKIFICLLLLIGFYQQSQAQFYDHVIGMRAGNTIGLSYKRFIFYYPDIQQAIEGVAGFQFDLKNRNRNAYVLEANYHLHIDVGFNTGFSAFAGAGLFGGFYTEVGQPSRFGGGISGVLGMEYGFTHAPVNVALDWKPFLGIPRSSLLGFGLTLRYIFPTTWQ
jgi:hypothetical protein